MHVVQFLLLSERQVFHDLELKFFLINERRIILSMFLEYLFGHLEHIANPKFVMDNWTVEKFELVFILDIFYMIVIHEKVLQDTVLQLVFMDLNSLVWKVFFN